MAGRVRGEMRGGRSAQRLSMRPAQNPLLRQIPAARTLASAPTTRPKTLPIVFFAINDSPSCPAPIAQHNAAQRSTSQIYFSPLHRPNTSHTPLSSCIDSLLRAGKSLTLSASAFFFSSLCPPSAAFNFNLKTCWFIRVGGTSDMVAFLFSGKMLPTSTLRQIFSGLSGFVPGGASLVRPSSGWLDRWIGATRQNKTQS